MAGEERVSLADRLFGSRGKTWIRIFPLHRYHEEHVHDSGVRWSEVHDCPLPSTDFPIGARWRCPGCDGIWGIEWRRLKV